MKRAVHSIALHDALHGVAVAPDRVVLPAQVQGTAPTAAAALRAARERVRELVEASGASWEDQSHGLTPEKLAGSGVFGGGPTRRTTARLVGALVVPLTDLQDVDARVDTGAALLDAVAELEGRDVQLGTLSWRHSDPEVLRARAAAAIHAHATVLAAQLGLPLTWVRTDGRLVVEARSPTELWVSMGCTLDFGSTGTHHTA